MSVEELLADLGFEWQPQPAGDPELAESHPFSQPALF